MWKVSQNVAHSTQPRLCQPVLSFSLFYKGEH